MAVGDQVLADVLRERPDLLERRQGKALQGDVDAGQQDGRIKLLLRDILTLRAEDDVRELADR